MKKFLVTLVCAVFAALTLVGFTACGDNADPEKVNLVAVDAESVVPNDQFDYFVVPEPAASAKIKATSSSPKGFKMVGDLQQLYGGDNGYPQAVVVAKSQFVGTEGSFISNFMTALQKNAEWLMAETTEISSIVNAVTSHLTEGMAPNFNANNLTKEVIANCGIRFEYAYNCKEEVKSFLTALKAVQPAVNDNPADGFFIGNNQTAAYTDGAVTVYAPDGAPALALAGLMDGEVSSNSLGKEVNYNIVDASTIQTHVTGANPDADICILPVNLAANLLGSGEKYTMLGTVTHGNLYIISAKTGEQITVDNISELCGKTVGVVNLAAVPGLTFKLILNKYGIEYAEPQA